MAAVAAIAAIGIQDGFVGEEEFRKTMVPAMALEDCSLHLLRLVQMLQLGCPKLSWCENLFGRLKI
jgi:hypothetical protein